MNLLVQLEHLLAALWLQMCNDKTGWFAGACVKMLHVLSASHAQRTNCDHMQAMTCRPKAVQADFVAL